jgi:peptide/nickel transport system substrate-binding protein
MSKIQSYNAVDPLTLSITLASPDSQFPRSMVGAFTYIGSPTAIQSSGAGFASNPIGAGPFTLKEWVRNDHTTLVKNPNYWDAPRPYIDQLIIKGVIDEQGQRLNTFQAGQADAMAVRSDIRVANTAKAAGANVLFLPQVVGSGLMMNEKHPGLNDKSVRTAFALALDRPALAQTVYGVDAPEGLFPKTSPFYDAAADYPKHDLAKAQSLIDAYVARTGSDIKLSFTVIANSPINLNYAQVIQAQLQQLKHVNVTIKPLDTATVVKENASGQTQLGLLAVNGPWPDSSLYDQFYSRGLQNNVAYNSPTTDAAFAAAHASSSVAAQTEAYKKVAQSMLDDMAFIATKHSVYAIVSHPNVANVKAFSDGGFQSDQVWLTR